MATGKPLSNAVTHTSDDSRPGFIRMGFMPLTRFTSLMRERNILVGRLFRPYESWCRITIGTEPEVTEFLKALREIRASA